MDNACAGTVAVCALRRGVKLLWPVRRPQPASHSRTAGPRKKHGKWWVRGYVLVAEECSPQGSAPRTKTMRPWLCSSQNRQAPQEIEIGECSSKHHTHTTHHAAHISREKRKREKERDMSMLKKGARIRAERWTISTLKLYVRAHRPRRSP